MGRRSELRARQHALTQVREVLAAMKNLSLAEALKLRPAAEAQQASMHVLERAVSDYLGHYGRAPRCDLGAPQVFFLMGSERGFCGAFNQSLWAALLARCAGDRRAIRIALAGTRMALRYGSDPRVALTIPMPARSNEMTGVLKRLYPLLRDQGAMPADFTVIYNDDTESGLTTRVVRPFSRLQRREPRLYPYPPRLHERPDTFLLELADEYLAGLMSAIYLTSVMAENRQRARHLEGAVREVDRRVEQVGFRLNAAVQEATTEEIEEIMLGVAALM